VAARKPAHQVRHAANATRCKRNQAASAIKLQTQHATTAEEHPKQPRRHGIATMARRRRGAAQQQPPRRTGSPPPHLRRDSARRCSHLRQDSARRCPHLHQDWARRCSHLRQDWARRCPHLRQDWARRCSHLRQDSAHPNMATRAGRHSAGETDRSLQRCRDELENFPETSQETSRGSLGLGGSLTALALAQAGAACGRVPAGDEAVCADGQHFRGRGVSAQVGSPLSITVRM
jgi:hypothetical protein